MLLRSARVSFTRFEFYSGLRIGLACISTVIWAIADTAPEQRTKEAVHQRSVESYIGLKVLIFWHTVNNKSLQFFSIVHDITPDANVRYASVYERERERGGGRGRGVAVITVG